MSTMPSNELFNEIVERGEKRLNDEYIRQQVELYKQEQAQKRQRDIEASNAEVGKSPSVAVPAGT